jgi:hypothetical protein
LCSISLFAIRPALQSGQGVHSNDEQGLSQHPSDMHKQYLTNEEDIGFPKVSIAEQLTEFHLDKEFTLMTLMMNNVSTKRKRCDDATSVKLWHYHLGHISRGRIERLIKDDILILLDFSNSDYCIDCIKGKYAKQVKKGEAKRSAGVLEIIHTGICGLFPIKSVDGFDSFITFIDDFSRYGYIYPIKERSEALDKFKIFKAEVEN